MINYIGIYMTKSNKSTKFTKNNKNEKGLSTSHATTSSGHTPGIGL
jgi:hypothetical protein